MRLLVEDNLTMFMSSGQNHLFLLLCLIQISVIRAQERNGTIVSSFPYGAFEVYDDTSAEYFLTITLPPPFELNDSLYLNLQSVKTIKLNLAVVLPQLNVSEDIIPIKIEEGAPLINSTVMSLRIAVILL